MAILQTVSLTKKYQMGDLEVHALQEVDLTVEAGEMVAVMGPSGSGKSTLLHLLGGLDYPTLGEVFLAGKALSGLSDRELTHRRRQQIGFIFQFYNLLPTLTAKENIILPLLMDGKPIFRYRKRLEELLNLVGLTDRKDHLPAQLSGGQQQRVAIARAFITEPKIVLADEPTGNLDSNSGNTVLSLLQKSCQTLGTTVVMVTHDPRAASYANRVLFLEDGRVKHDIYPGEGESAVRRIIEEMAKMEM